MLSIFARAPNLTHKYLQAVGARVAPDKCHNFATTPSPTKWLSGAWWDEIDNNIEVIKVFRYLGAHLNTKANIRSPTLTSRWYDALQQL